LAIGGVVLLTVTIGLVMLGTLLYGLLTNELARIFTGIFVSVAVLAYVIGWLLEHAENRADAKAQKDAEIEQWRREHT
jgi:di/tricarboxylate transporter